MLMRDDLCDLVRPGDRVKVVGIMESRTEAPLTRGKMPLFQKYIEGVSIVKESEEFTDIEIDEEDEQAIKDLSTNPNIHRIIRNTIAPVIFGALEEKEAISYLLFGGTSKVAGDGTKIRGESNILLIGDPGMGKSQILKSVADLVPRGLYTSGRGSSAAGLTASVIRDQDTGEMTLEAGAVVLADKGVAFIDEFDKMRREDRSDLHEAMEQHCYHPNTEIRFLDGSTSNIGQFIDSIFLSDPNLIQEGIDCQLIDIQPFNKGIISSNFHSQLNNCINRVSRHLAPDFFYELVFSNGRKIQVNPDHPVFVFQINKIITKPAKEIEEGSFVPVLNEIGYSGSTNLEIEVEQGKKELFLPNQINERLAKFLGYFVSEGYSYHGSTFEVGLGNTDEMILEDMKNNIQQTFNITPIDYSKENHCLRIVSKSIYNFMKSNFPELITKSIYKRIPSGIFRSTRKERIAFIYGAYQGDGSAETETCAFNTSCQGLAYDYQDLLLSLGIHTRISSYQYTYSEDKTRIRYKIYVIGESLADFYNLFSSPLKNESKIIELVERSNKSNYKKNNVPIAFVTLVTELMKDLNLTYDGRLWKYQDSNSGISKIVIEKYLKKIIKRINTLSIIIENDTKNLRSYRELIGYSQDSVARFIGDKRKTIDYIERGGYTEARRQEILTKIKKQMKIVLAECKNKYQTIENLLEIRWNTIKSIQKIPNSGEIKTNWVYDITVLPNQSFVSQGGLILHNSVSIAKAGIVATLNARTSILAAANPKLGRWDTKKDAIDNLNLPSTIISRFDLIFPIIDTPNRNEDELKASHILKIHQHTQDFTGSDESLNKILLRKYIAFARKNIHPFLTNEAREEIMKFYLDLREGKVLEKAVNEYNNEQGLAQQTQKPRTIAITPRQLESLIRLSEARAKIALHNEVSREDAVRVIELFKSSLNRVTKGDIDTLYGMSSQKRNKREIVLNVITNLSQGNATPDMDDILRKAREEGMEDADIRDMIDQLLQNGEIYEPRPGTFKKMTD